MIARRPSATAAIPTAALVAFALAGCSSTYVESSATTAPPSVATTLPAIATDAPLDELFVELDALMRRLDEQIVEAQGDVVALARIDEVWVAAEQQIRERDPDDLFPFEQAILLARTGVERRRPADASKGYKLLVAAVTAYDTSV